MNARYDCGAVKFVDVRDHAALLSQAEAWVYRQWGAARMDATTHRVGFLKELAAVPDAARLSPSLPCCVLAMIDDACGGTISIARDDGLAAPYNEASEMTPWLAAVYVDPPFRGRGLAGLMVEHACARLAADGADAVFLYTAHQQNMYRRLGFRPIAETIEPFEGGVGVTVMRRAL